MKKKKALPKFLFGPVTNRPEEVLTSKYGYLLALCDMFHRYSGTYHA